MKLSGGILLGASIAVASADPFEPPDFNVTDALIKNGIDISSVPGLAGLVGRSSNNGCSVACNSLNFLFGNSSVLFEGSSAYDAFTGAYWSGQQGQVNPFCIFKPTSALQVSTTVLISRLTQCPFAAKSGGHAAFAGASSIEGGITIALDKMDSIVLSSDKKLAAIGPGNIWLRVYETLEKESLVVIGGRVQDIGVSGLTLGGGISHFANMRGWACDNVDSYEVVTASGLIITASATSHPDLYWSLRGGGNNFGVVTKFKYRTFAQGPMWGGPRLLLEPEFDAVYTAFTKIAQNSAKDVKAAQIASFGVQAGFKLCITEIEYADPTPWPAIFDEYKAIPAAQDNTAIANLSTLTRNLGGGQPTGARQTYWDWTSKLDRDFMKFSVDTLFELVSTIADAPGVLPALSFQAITVPAMQGMQQNGGNALGLDPSGGPIHIANLALKWDDPADDERMYSFSNTLWTRLRDEAAKRSLQSDFIYMNYASPWQDPIGSYGEKNKNRLKQVAGVYDPTGVFQRLAPGYFKLEGKPFGEFPA
ncbi:hypothetical protein HBI47_097900 [Parastagonospora nodorum]|nr:hypothetical protein HBI47_097900 [Parastagonospora nodorum]